jgi:hypothetical protein
VAEPIRVSALPDGRFLASTDIPGGRGLHVSGETAEDARARLGSYIAELRRTTIPVCARIGQGRVYQCKGGVDVFAVAPSAFEHRCTTCDDVKPPELVERLDREWKERWGAQGRPTGFGPKTETEG